MSVRAASTGVVLILAALTAGCTDGHVLAGPEETVNSRPLAPTALAAARAGVSERRSVSGNLWNRCTGEYVAIEGTLTSVFRLREDAGDGYHWLSNYALHGTAVGLTTGHSYVYNEIHNMKENGALPFDGLFDDTGAYYFTMSFIATLISQGAWDNQTFQWDIRYKMDRAGEVTMEEVRREFLCQG